MYLFRKKADLYDDVIASAFEVAEKVLAGKKVDVNNEDCAKYKGGYSAKVKSKYYINQKITINCMEYYSLCDGIGGMLTLYSDKSEEYNVTVCIQVLTPDLYVKHKYSKFNIGDNVRICGLIDLSVIPGVYTDSYKNPTRITVTIME